MMGTLLNVVAIIAGSALGLLFGARLPEALKNTMVSAMGLFTAAIGLKMFLQTSDSLVVASALILGALLGEWWRIEDRIAVFGAWLERRFAGGGGQGTSSRFVRGFLVASLLYCTGPMAILGSIQDGLTGQFELLAIKSLLDGLISIAFASSLGIGVMFSSVPLLIYQGGITLLAGSLDRVLSDRMITELSATGGLILVGLALSNLLEIRKVRVGNFLPALLIAPLMVWVMTIFGR